MYKITMTDDHDGVYGFAVLDLEPFPLTDPVEVGKKIRDLAESGYAVIYIAETLTTQVEPGVGRFREADLPAVILIPGVSGSTDKGAMAVKRLVEQAVDSGIIFNGQQCSQLEGREMSKGVTKKVTGPLVIAEGIHGANMSDAVRISNQRLIGEIIEIHDGETSVRIYEETSGLGPGEPVGSTGVPMSVGLGPGLVGNIYDDIQRPLDTIVEKAGRNLLGHGVEVPSPKHEKEWTLKLTMAQGDKVDGGDIISVVQETDVVVQKIMIPVEIQEALTYINSSKFAITDTVAAVTDKKGQEHPVTPMQKQPVRKNRPYQRRLSPDMPLVAGQKAIDCLFPIVKGGVVAVPRSFGLGKTVVQHQLVKWTDADIVVYIGCSERDNEMIDVLNEFPELKNPRTGKSLMERIVLIANTSDMPIAACETSIYTGITVAEYFRDMSYSVALMTNSVSHRAETLCEVLKHLEEIPGEEGYPAYLGSCLAQFYERTDQMISLNNDSREDAPSIIGAIFPAGDDASGPVTQTTLHIVEVFWFLDADPAYRRYFPVINWFTSYSLYVDTMEEWFNAGVESDRAGLCSCPMCLLQEESELSEIVQLVGMNVLSAPDRLKPEATRSIHEDFLHQNTFHEIDTFVPLRRQYIMMRLMMTYYGQSRDALGKGVDVERLVSPPVREAVSRFKYTEEPDLDKVYADAIRTLENEVNDGLSRKEDF